MRENSKLINFPSISGGENGNFILNSPSVGNSNSNICAPAYLKKLIFARPRVFSFVVECVTNTCTSEAKA